MISPAAVTRSLSCRAEARACMRRWQLSAVAERLDEARARASGSRALYFRPNRPFFAGAEAIFRSASSSASVVVRSCARASCVADAHAAVAVIFELRAISVIGAVVNRNDCTVSR